MPERLKNFLLCLLSVALGYTILEFGVWRQMLMEVPLNLQSEIGRLGPFGQTSKQGIEPHDYVLLVGDSNIEGLGDWLLRVTDDGNPRYNAAHILHEMSDRDVISFGVRGGNTGFNIENTMRTYTGANLYTGLELRPPSDMIVVFFAGNDINDETAYLKWFEPETYTALQAGDYQRALAYAHQRALDGIEVGERRWHWLRNATLFDTATKLAKRLVKAILAPHDSRASARTTGRFYSENWERYRDSPVHFYGAGTILAYAKNTVEPFAFHSTEEIGRAALMFRAALAVYREHFPHTRIWAAYLPSPIMAYDLVAPDVVLRDRIRGKDDEVEGPPVTFTVPQLERQSDAICAAVRGASEAAGAHFIDTTPYLRTASRDGGHLHGPNDPGHLNERGYTAFAQALAAGLSAAPSQSCALSTQRHS